MAEKSRQAAKSGATAAPGARARLKQENREGLIVERAIRYFAKVGFHGNTRELARSIGISQPLLYHYFASKDALIEQIFDRIYASKWKPLWEDWLRDRTMPLSARLERFYADYTDTVLTDEWTRIFFFAALRDVNIHKRNTLIVRERIVHVLIREMRAEFEGEPRDRPITAIEEELGWDLHTGIFYLAIRQAILDTPSPLGRHPATKLKIAMFLAGARSVLAQEAQPAA
ncbi:TetR family transcriptional regulator [Stella humosa]|uniref:TetR family transcriptional regulator n=1 Tax=Stella humosa TaxID=94 RepID=A0A3N1M7G9_9PROT|nr:TetR/AcrR family transcriptional regulator [Stella humosa]ROP99630.1 TetR family transcriptional regulator [Stella humosa]BBK31145.1 TetR family transcriptional regulator [Stella humosa]